MGVDRRTVVAIFSGGAIGALLRAGLVELLPAEAGRWPWPTFLANVLGCFLLGYLITRLQERLPLSAYRRPLLGTGLCGALTTFSTFQIELTTMLRDGDTWLAAGYASASIAAGRSRSQCQLRSCDGHGCCDRAGCTCPRHRSARRRGRGCALLAGWFRSAPPQRGVSGGHAGGKPERFRRGRGACRRRYGGDASLVLLGGGIASFTTFSTWVFEGQRLAEEGELRLGALNLGVSFAAGLAVAAASRAVGELL